MSGPEGVLATIRVLATIVRSGELGAVGDRLSTGGEGCRGGLFGERLKDRCTEGDGCGGDGTWARKKGPHCGGQPTPPTEERNPKLLGCRCGKACPILLLVSPFEHCHTRFGCLSLSVGTAWSCRSAGIMCRQGGGGRMQRAKVQWCTGAEIQR